MFIKFGSFQRLKTDVWLPRIIFTVCVHLPTCRPLRESLWALIHELCIIYNLQTARRKELEWLKLHYLLNSKARA